MLDVLAAQLREVLVDLILHSGSNEAPPPTPLVKLALQFQLPHGGHDFDE